MRKLKTDDMFIISEIADKMDLNLDVKGKSQEQVGADLFLQIVKKIHKAKVEINALISGLTGKTKEEISEQPLNETIQQIKEILGQDGVLDFLKR